MLLPAWVPPRRPYRYALEGYEQSLLYGEHTWAGVLWIYGKYLAYYGDRGARTEGRALRPDRVVLGRAHRLHRTGIEADR